MSAKRRPQPLEINGAPRPAAGSGRDRVAEPGSAAWRAFTPPVVVDRDGYAWSDGEPLAFGDHQLGPLFYAGGALRGRYAGRPDVYVGVDLFIHYEQGNRAAAFAPDVFVAPGARSGMRRSYKLWEEPTPAFVLEILSPDGWRRDVGEKRALCERLGVGEYWLHDPQRLAGDAPLVAYRLRGGVYERLPESAAGWLPSEALGLELRERSPGELRIRDAATGEELPSLEEERAARQVAEAVLLEEAAARQTAEAVLLEEAAARQTAEAVLLEEAAARQVAEATLLEEAAARQVAEAARQSAEAARQSAEARVAELETLLDAQRRAPRDG